MNTIDRCLYGVLLGGLCLGLGASVLHPTLYTDSLAAEDGLFEWATALFLLIGAFMCARRVRLPNKARIFAVISAIGALVLVFGAGEEVSWGQRVFGWASGEFWVENNEQAETNLHNLVVGDVKLNKVFFGVTLTLLFVLYFALLPILHFRHSGIAAWADRWGVPVPHWHHGAAFVVSLVVMSLVPTGRSAELGEFALGLLLAAVVLSPANKAAFR